MTYRCLCNRYYSLAFNVYFEGPFREIFDWLIQIPIMVIFYREMIGWVFNQSKSVNVMAKNAEEILDLLKYHGDEVGTFVALKEYFVPKNDGSILGIVEKIQQGLNNYKFLIQLERKLSLENGIYVTIYDVNVEKKTVVVPRKEVPVKIDMLGSVYVPEDPIEIEIEENYTRFDGDRTCRPEVLHTIDKGGKSMRSRDNLRKKRQIPYSEQFSEDGKEIEDVQITSASFKFLLNGSSGNVIIVRGEVKQEYKYDDDIPEDVEVEDLPEYHCRRAYDRAILGLFLDEKEKLKTFHVSEPLRKEKFSEQLLQFGYDIDLVIFAIRNSIRIILDHLGVSGDAMERKMNHLLGEMKKKPKIPKLDQITEFALKSDTETVESTLQTVEVSVKNLVDAEAFVKEIEKTHPNTIYQNHTSGQCFCRSCYLKHIAVILSK